jgi:hypothetical protein
MSTSGDTVDIEIDIEGLKKAKEKIDGLARYFDANGDYSLDTLATEHSDISGDWVSWNDGGTSFVSGRVRTVSHAVNNEIAKLKQDLAAIAGLLGSTISDHHTAEQANKGVVGGTNGDNSGSGWGAN